MPESSRTNIDKHTQEEWMTRNNQPRDEMKKNKNKKTRRESTKYRVGSLRKHNKPDFSQTN